MFRHFSSNLVLVTATLLMNAGCRHAEQETAGDTQRQPIAPGTVLLHSDTQESIGLLTAKVGRQRVREQLSRTGWLMTTPGNEVVLRASATGFVMPASAMKMVELGSIVIDRQELATLHIFVSPQEEAQLVALKEDADIIIEQSLASLAIAEDRYDKVKNLEGALAGKEISVLQEVVERSRAAVKEARDKLPFLPPEPYERPLRLKDVVIETPLAGRITQIHVRSRQLVVQGDPLWTISDWSTLWVRVPIFEGELPHIDQGESVEITAPGLKTPIPAKPTGVPQPTEIGRRTVDVMYQIDNSDGRLRPGQPVSAVLPTGRSAEQLVIPQSAILWDGMGNSWVYVQDNAEHFRRQRTQLGQVYDNLVVIERGLDEGQQVVVVGAEALYGEEFKSQTEAEDND